MGKDENRELLLRCIDAFNLCTMEWLDIFYSKSIEWISMPTQMDPRGKKGGFKEFWQTSEQFLKMIPNRQLRVLSSVCENDTVILEQELKGNFAKDFSNIKAGTESSAIVVSFFTVNDSLIVKHKDYCVRNIPGLN
jgi:hypothetical protein